MCSTTSRDLQHHPQALDHRLSQPVEFERKVGLA